MEPAFQVLVAPSVTAPGPGREVRTLLDLPHLKLAAVALRGGTDLPAHESRVPVTITILSGAGEIVVGEERRRVTAGHVIALAPGVRHAMKPDAGTDAVLLVHHLREIGSGGPR